VESDEIEATNNLARAVLEDLRPAELPLLPATQAAFWARDGKLSAGRYGEAIGFGDAGQIGVALAPIALAVGAFALEVLRDLLKKLVISEGESKFAALKSRLRKGDAAPLEVSQDVYAALREKVAAEAREHLPEDLAKALAQAIMASVAVPVDETAGSQ